MNKNHRASWLQQKENFDRLKARAQDTHQKLAWNAGAMASFFHPEWNFINSMIASDFFPVPPEDFLQIKHVGGTMFVGAWGDWFLNQYNFLRENMPPAQVAYAMAEDWAGGILNKCRIIDGIVTSHNTVHHAYHIEKYKKETEKSFDNVQSILEWGGGYGNLAKIISRIELVPTYTLVDSPVLLTLQWLYLSSILGEDAVNLLTEKNPVIAEGKINMLPVDCLDVVGLSNIDMFISTWAISESSRSAKEYVMQNKFFGADNILIAFHQDPHKFTGSDMLIESIVDIGGKISEISFMPDKHYYLVK